MALAFKPFLETADTNPTEWTSAFARWNKLVMWKLLLWKADSADMIVCAIQFISCISFLLDQINVFFQMLIKCQVVLLHIKWVVCAGVKTDHVIHSCLRGASREHLSILTHWHFAESHRVNLRNRMKLLIWLMNAVLHITDLKLFDSETYTTKFHYIAERNLNWVPDFFQLVGSVLNLLPRRQFFGALVR